MNRTLVLLLIAVPLLAMQAFLYFALGPKGFSAHLPLLLAVNGLLGGIVLLVQPLTAFTLVAAYLPFARIGIEFGVGPATLNPYSAGMICMLFTSLLVKLFTGRKLHINTTDLFLLGVCSVFLYTTLVSPTLMDAGFLAFNSLFIPSCSYGVTRILIQDEKSYDLLIKGLLLSFSLFAIFSMLTFLGSGTRAALKGSPPVGTATVLALAVCYLATKLYFPRALRKVLFIVCLAAFLLTFTRVYLLALLAAPLLYKVVRAGRAYKLYLAFFVSTVILTFAVIGAAAMFKPNVTFVDQDTRKTSERLTSEQYWLLSIYGRIEQYEMGLDNFVRKPFFGTGLYKGPVNITQHNFHIEWLEYGGLIGYMLFIGFFLSHAWRMGPLARDDMPIALNLLVVLMVLMNCLTNGLLHGHMPTVVLLVMGMSEARAIFMRRRLVEEAEA